MDGLEVLRRIRARFGVTELPVVMASALGESRDLVEALRLGANDYVTKPLDMQVVLARVGTQLALRRASEEVTRLAAQLKAAQERISTLLSTGERPSSTSAAGRGRWPKGSPGRSAPARSPSGSCRRRRSSRSPPRPPSLPLPAAVALLPAGESLYVSGARAVAPIRGPRGDLLGALVADGKGDWDDVERGLLLGFAHQLGGALELHRMKEQLAAARQKSSRLPGDDAVARDPLRLPDLRPLLRAERAPVRGRRDAPLRAAQPSAPHPRPLPARCASSAKGGWGPSSRRTTRSSTASWR